MGQFLAAGFSRLEPPSRELLPAIDVDWLVPIAPGDRNSRVEEAAGEWQKLTGTPPPPPPPVVMGGSSAADAIGSTFSSPSVKLLSVVDGLVSDSMI